MGSDCFWFTAQHGRDPMWNVYNISSSGRASERMSFNSVVKDFCFHKWVYNQSNQSNQSKSEGVNRLMLHLGRWSEHRIYRHCRDDRNRRKWSARTFTWRMGEASRTQWQGIFCQSQEPNDAMGRPQNPRVTQPFSFLPFFLYFLLNVEIYFFFFFRLEWIKKILFHRAGKCASQMTVSITLSITTLGQRRSKTQDLELPKGKFTLELTTT